MEFLEILGFSQKVVSIYEKIGDEQEKEMTPSDHEYYLTGARLAKKAGLNADADRLYAKEIERILFSYYRLEQIDSRLRYFNPELCIEIEKKKNRNDRAGQIAIEAEMLPKALELFVKGESYLFAARVKRTLSGLESAKEYYEKALSNCRDKEMYGVFLFCGEGSRLNIAEEGELKDEAREIRTRCMIYAEEHGIFKEALSHAKVLGLNEKVKLYENLISM